VTKVTAITKYRESVQGLPRVAKRPAGRPILEDDSELRGRALSRCDAASRLRLPGGVLGSCGLPCAPLCRALHRQCYRRAVLALPAIDAHRMVHGHPSSASHPDQDRLCARRSQSGRRREIGPCCQRMCPPRAALELDSRLQAGYRRRYPIRARRSNPALP
jgi:hypothetical protein